MIKSDEESKKLSIYTILIEIFMIALGTYLISLGTNMFLLPHKMTTGGASGIATIFYYIFNVPMGITIMIINIPLFIMSIWKIGFKFSIKTIFAVALLSAFYEIFKYESLLARSPIDLFTSCIFGGLIVGLGLSLVLKTGASTGGSDLLAQIIFRLTKIQSLSQILLIIEAVIISLIIIVFKDINVGLYSMIAMYISTKVIDIVFEGIYYTKVATIITNKPDDIIEGIFEKLNRSATIIDSIGAHSKRENKTVTCIITNPQIGVLKQIVRNCDTSAIMYICTSNEVIGKGFKSIE